MKRIIVLAAASFVFLGSAFSQVAYTTLTPKTAKSMGMGGVFSSVQTAEFSFFGNPAAFAATKGTLFFPSVDTWIYARPTMGNIKDLAAAVKTVKTDEGPLLTKAFGLMAENGGTGVGVNVGLGYAGKGLGLGAFVTTDEYIEGTNPASATVHSETQATAVVGLGVPIKLGGLRLAIGGDLRPFYRVSLEETALAGVLSHTSDIETYLRAKAFFGAAVDLGATLQFSAFTLGLSIRDIAPSYAIWQGSLADLETSLTGGTLPKTSDDSVKAVFKTNVTAGLSWTPKFIPGLIEPSLYFELQDPVSVFNNWNGIGSALNLLHAGAEVKVLSFITLRGGVNRGWLSAGAGVKLLFIDLNASVFSEELGALPGDQPRSGLAIQAAIRF